MERISGVEKEMRKEVKALNGRVDGLSNYVDILGREVCEHIYPPSTVRSDGIIPSSFFWPFVSLYEVEEN